MKDYSIPLHPENPWLNEPELLEAGDPQSPQHIWNAMSPELEFCQYVQDQLAQLTTETFQGLLVVETGVGQGFVTRRILEVLRRQDYYVGYDTDSHFLEMIPPQEDWADRTSFNVFTPGSITMGQADFVVLDSDMKVRPDELSLWIKTGKAGSHLIIHDTPQMVSPSPGLVRLVYNSGIEGHFTDNLRGGWHAVHP